MFLFGAPVLAICTRIAARPLADAWERIRAGDRLNPPSANADQRISRLQNEVEELKAELASQAEEDAFDRALIRSSPDRSCVTPPVPTPKRS